MYRASSRDSPRPCTYVLGWSPGGPGVICSKEVHSSSGPASAGRFRFSSDCPPPSPRPPGRGTESVTRPPRSMDRPILGHRLGAPGTLPPEMDDPGTGAFSGFPHSTIPRTRPFSPFPGTGRNLKRWIRISLPLARFPPASEPGPTRPIPVFVHFRENRNHPKYLLLLFPVKELLGLTYPI